MGDWYGSYKSGGSSRQTMNVDEEFQEEDVWSALRDQKEEEDTSPVSKLIEQPAVISRKLPTAVRMIPRSHHSERVLQEPAKMVRESAPVCIPDWSKIYGKNIVMEAPRDEDEDEDGNVEMMPPHEWMAGKLAKSKKTSFSVCEGAGRTLKGRDLRKVRHAVLTRTGFLEF